MTMKATNQKAAGKKPGKPGAKAVNGNGNTKGNNPMPNNTPKSTNMGRGAGNHNGANEATINR